MGQPSEAVQPLPSLQVIWDDVHNGYQCVLELADGMRLVSSGDVRIWFDRHGAQDGVPTYAGIEGVFLLQPDAADVVTKLTSGLPVELADGSQADVQSILFTRAGVVHLRMERLGVPPSTRIADTWPDY